MFKITGLLLITLLISGCHPIAAGKSMQDTEKIPYEQTKQKGAKLSIEENISPTEIVDVSHENGRFSFSIINNQAELLYYNDLFILEKWDNDDGWFDTKSTHELRTLGYGDKIKSIGSGEKLPQKIEAGKYMSGLSNGLYHIQKYYVNRKTNKIYRMALQFEVDGGKITELHGFISEDKFSGNPLLDIIPIRDEESEEGDE